MKIAITGGAGFIGTALAERLVAAGHEVTLLDLVPSPVFPRHSKIVDITNADLVADALSGVDAIYHLAAVHHDDVKPLQRYFTVNVGGTENIIVAANTHGIKTIIYTSSVAVYGLNAGESRESDALAPFNDYGRSKFEAEKILNAWADENPDNTLVTVRLVATFGPGNRGNIYNLIDQIAQGRFMMVGTGRNKKSIAWVGNAAAFLVHALNLGPGNHLYNYADKPDMTMNQLVGAIRRAFGLKGLGPRLPYSAGMIGAATFDAAAQIIGKTFPISIIRVKKFCANTIINTDKVKATGFAAPDSLKSSLVEMIEADFLKKKLFPTAA